MRANHIFNTSGGWIFYADWMFGKLLTGALFWYSIGLATTASWLLTSSVAKKYAKIREGNLKQKATTTSRIPLL